MDRTHAATWFARYERAWREADVAAVTDLFTEDARYQPAPFEDPEIGHAAIQAFWADDAGRDFTVSMSPVAIDDTTAVLRLEVHYRTPQPSAYRNLWVVRFASDGRAAHFEEWAFFPGQPSSAGPRDAL